MKLPQKSPAVFATIPSLKTAKTYTSISLPNPSAKPNSLTKPKSYETFSSKEFLSSIIHELKNPLSAVLGLADILEEEMAHPQSKESLAECLSYIADIKQTALEMNELVHDLLDASSSASGNFSVDLSKEIDVQDAIKRSVKMNYDYALRRSVRIKTEIAANVKPIKLDARRMKQIVTNLISNAVKYSPKNTEIKISVQQVTTQFTTQFTAGREVARDDFSVAQTEFLEISIADQGFGMTESQIQTAFQKYQTIPNPNSGIVDSFGLGLPITKQLIELQNGTIEVKSELNQGTEIKLKLPY